MAVSPANGRSQAVQLGADLRELRKQTGRTVVQVAEALGMHHSTISRWERGDTMPDEADTGALLAIYGVTGEERAWLVRLARPDSPPTWAAPAGKQFAAFTKFESLASHIVEVNPLLIPGLLQTADYARSLMTDAGLPPDRIERGVAHRMRRRHVLTHRHPARLTAVIGEHAVRHPPCSNTVAHDQLRHLRMMAELPNVTIRVLPMYQRRYTTGLEGPFMYFEFPHEDPIAYVENFCSTSMLTAEHVVRSYRDSVDAILRNAMSEQESRAYIGNVRTG